MNKFLHATCSLVVWLAIITVIKLESAGLDMNAHNENITGRNKRGN